MYACRVGVQYVANGACLSSCLPAPSPLVLPSCAVLVHSLGHYAYTQRAALLFRLTSVQL